MEIAVVEKALINKQSLELVTRAFGGVTVPGMPMSAQTIHNAVCIFDAAGNYINCIGFTAKEWAATTLWKSLSDIYTSCSIRNWTLAQGSNFTLPGYDAVYDADGWNVLVWTTYGDPTTTQRVTGIVWTWANTTVNSTASALAETVTQCAASAAAQTYSVIGNAFGYARGLQQVLSNTSAYILGNQTGFTWGNITGYYKGLVAGFIEGNATGFANGIAEGIAQGTAQATSNLVKIAVPVAVVAGGALVVGAFFAGHELAKRRAAKMATGTTENPMREVSDHDFGSANSGDDSIERAAPTPKLNK